MSLINEYRATEEAIKELQARLANLSQNDKLQKDLDFEKKVRALMGEYSMSLPELVSLMDPESKVVKADQVKATRRPRKVKQYKNPHDGSIIETKGGNHKELKAWKAQYGDEVVEGWATLLD